MEFYRIIIADDLPLHRESLEKTLTRVLPSATVFNASKGEQVMEILSKAIIDLIFLKFPMPGVNGIELIREIRNLNADIKIVSVLMQDDKETIATMLEEGVNGIIYDNIDKLELKNLIAAMSNGDLYLPEEVSK